MNYQETLTYISSVNWKGSVPGLERITELMHKLGDPQNGLKFIHIGGTNGKGSTAAFTSHILQEAGYKVGLFISPYIEVFNERMQINGCNIADGELAEITTKIRPFADSMKDVPTEFELNTAIALMYFAQNHCDIVVFEVGMGGEFDATNVIAAPEVAVITAIGLDHTEYLGDTLEKIAATKAGIIKPGCDVVLYRQSPEVTEVISKRCRETGAALFVSEPEKLQRIRVDLNGQLLASPYGELSISMAASYQLYNVATVLRIMEVLKRRGYPVTTEQIRKGLSKTRWPGRFEVLHKEPVFLVDGAHNPQGITAAADSLRTVFPDRKLIFLFGVLADKDYPLMLKQILPLAKEVLCVAPPNSRALPAADLARLIQQNHVPAQAFEDLKSAVEAGFERAGAQDILCAIGSLYMIGDIKTILKQIHPERSETMAFCDKTCREFVALLASKEPAPGGGGAAALCGAVGTALGNMVGSLTVGKKKYSDVQERILQMKARCDELQEELLQLVQLDAEAFKPLAEAYRMPAGTEEEKARKAEALEACGKDACEVPFAIMRKCCEGISLAEEFARIGSRLAVSDAGCAAVILESALRAASLNIFINTKSLLDRDYAASMNRQANEMLTQYGEKARAVFAQVKASLEP